MNNLVDSNEPEEHSYQYDLMIIGGGSGGLSCAKRAFDLGKKVALADFVKPSTQGTTWGLGGTCVNVGCIPKKLMHQASLVGEHLRESRNYGWMINTQNLPFSWERLVDNVQAHIGSLNFGYRTEMVGKRDVDYLNELVTFIDPHTVQTVDDSGVVTIRTARRFVIAVGGRPTLPDTPGVKEYAITSDDIFSMNKVPGKTLVVGASYVALECAGFLKGMGFDTTVMVRSILLRGFDQQMAELIGKSMEEHGIKFIRPTVPDKIEKLESGKLKVTYTLDGQSNSEEYDTVMYATGRYPDTQKLGVDKAGIKVDANGKIIVTEDDRTSVPHIYAIGDCSKGRPELTPSAIKAGKLLANRLYAGAKQLMDYINIPTTVFTPLEYGACGYSEEDAIAKFGEENIEVYHTYFQPLEFNLPQREENSCYVKLICNKADDERVIGFHILGPNAGEVTQGYAVAIRVGATKKHFDDTVGIHPTVSEEVVILDKTKRSGVDPKKSGC